MRGNLPNIKITPLIKDYCERLDNWQTREELIPLLLEIDGNGADLEVEEKDYLWEYFLDGLQPDWNRCYFKAYAK